jgi:beta-lactamase regulating signal transducer with metallopeptidase domain
MIDFLTTSTASLFVLLVCYHLLLEKEKMHQFNRFFLLFSLTFSLLIPFFTIQIIREIPTATTQNTFQFVETPITALKESTNYWLWFLSSIYILVTIFLLIRFIKNGLQLYKRAKSNESIAFNNAKLVLLPNPTLPYTFLKTIFVNKDDYENRQIENELYTHELIHVAQKHTLDILLIETLKVVFWFNPILYFYKKAIQLNHEFLADEKVVQEHNNVPFYQNLLLSKANANPTYYLASNLNYSVTKKRLIMMTKNTSASRALLKKGLVIPILTALVFSFCTKVVAQTKSTTKEVPTKNKSKLFENYYEKTTFEVIDESGKVVATKKYSELTPKEKNIVPPVILQKNEPFTTESFDKAIQKGGPETFVVDPFDKKNIKVKSDDENAVYNSAGITEMPKYQGGMEAFYQFIAKNYTISEEAVKQKLKGKVYVTFIVEKDGSLSDIKVLRDIGFGTGEEALRVMSICPKWTPGKINDEPVRVMYSLPITIQTAG